MIWKGAEAPRGFATIALPFLHLWKLARQPGLHRTAQPANVVPFRHGFLERRDDGPLPLSERSQIEV